MLGSDSYIMHRAWRSALRGLDLGAVLLQPLRLKTKSRVVPLASVQQQSQRLALHVCSRPWLHFGTDIDKNLLLLHMPLFAQSQVSTAEHL